MCRNTVILIVWAVKFLCSSLSCSLTSSNGYIFQHRELLKIDNSLKSWRCARRNLFLIRKMLFKCLTCSDQCIQYFRNHFPESVISYTIMIPSIFDYMFNIQLLWVQNMLYIHILKYTQGQVLKLVASTRGFGRLKIWWWVIFTVSVLTDLSL